MKKLAACLAIALCVIISTNSLPFVADVDLGDAPFSNFFDEMLDEEVYEPETEEESDIVDEGEEVQVEDEIESDENAEENEDVEYEKEEKEEEEGLEGEKVGEKAAEGQVNIINPMQEGVIDFTPTAFTWLEGSDPNIWYETPDYEITLAAAPAGTAFTRLLTLIRNAEPDAITHIIIPFHINTGPITGDVTTVRVPDGATVVLVGAHPTAANEQVVISDSHGGTNISRPFRVRGNNEHRTALVFRNVVLQRSATVAQGTPATPPAALAPSSQSGTSRGGGVTIEPAEGGGGHFVLCRGGEIRNSTTDNNGPIDIQTSGRFTMMQGSALYDNAAGNSGGAVHVNTNANFTMNGGVIHNNTARGENTANPLARAVGGAVFIQNGGTFDMYGGEIFANSASLSTIAAIPSVTNAIVTSCGGAVFVTGATSSFNMHGGTIRDNNATRTRASDTAAANRFLFRSGNGGGVYATEGATFTMQGGVIQNNIATTSGVVTVNNALNVANGGGVYITGAGTTFRMAGGFILGNQALRTLSSVPITLLTALHIYAGNGGGVHAFDGATFNMESGTISNNIAHATGATPAFNINGTTSLSNGGGVFIAGDGTTMNMSGGQIEGNSASGSVAASSSISGNGGGVHIAAGARLNMSNGTISNNSALNLNSPATPRGNGAGVYVSGSSSIFDMSGGGIQNHNNVTRHGVGLFLTDGALVNISNNAQISNNNSPDNGGGVYLEFSGMVNMSGGTISGNTAALNGGGVFLNGTSGGAFEMYGGTIGGSNTAQHGGGVAIETGDFFVLDPSATIAHNQAYLGGGVYVSIGGRFSGQDGSIANNHAIANGGGLFSEFYLNEDTLPIFAYLNLHTSDRFIFSGNTASVASRPPYNYNELFHMQSASSSIPNSHILNNFDINFFLEPLVPTFTFTKTDTSLNPLSGAVFDLDGQVQTSDGDGQISFELTLGREYRLEEISPPPGHMPSLGHWAISANGFSPSDITITPSDGAREFAFRDGVWYVDNEIEIFPIPFYLHKTDNQLYSLESFENVGHILLAGATFELHRYTAPDQWQLISTATSTADISQPMVFELIAGEVYRLVETQAPAGFTTPKGQWQITPQDNGADAPPTFTIVAMGDTLLPAFAQIGDYFYVGNRPQLTLPLTGGSGASAFLALGGLVLILLSLAITWRYIISKKLRRQYYEK